MSLVATHLDGPLLKKPMHILCTGNMPLGTSNVESAYANKQGKSSGMTMGSVACQSANSVISTKAALMTLPIPSAACCLAVMLTKHHSCNVRQCLVLRLELLLTEQLYPMSTSVLSSKATACSVGWEQTQPSIGLRLAWSPKPPSLLY